MGEDIFNLCSDEELLAPNFAGMDPSVEHPADDVLVGVGRGGVDVPIARLQRRVQGRLQLCVVGRLPQHKTHIESPLHFTF